MTTLRIQFASVPDEDNVIAELLADEREFAHVAQQGNQEIVAIYQATGDAREIDMPSLIDLLQRAKQGLRQP